MDGRKGGRTEREWKRIEKSRDQKREKIRERNEERKNKEKERDGEIDRERETASRKEGRIGELHEGPPTRQTKRPQRVG